MNDPIRVIIAEPQPIFMQGLLHQLENGNSVELVAQTTEGQETMEAITEHAPDVVILADSLTEPSGVKILESLEGSNTKVIFLTAEASKELVYHCIVRGASGYLVKWEINVNIAEAIKQVMAGGTVVSPSGLRDFVEAVRDRAHTRVQGVLTPREIQVVDLLRQGYSQAQIADELSVSLATVRSHCRNAFGKLGANNQAMAVGEALQRGLID